MREKITLQGGSTTSPNPQQRVGVILATESGKHLVAGCYSWELRIWSLPKYKHESSLELPSKIQTMKEVSRGLLLIAGQSENNLMLFSMASLSIISQIDQVLVFSIQPISRDPIEFITGNQDSIQFWKLENTTSPFTFSQTWSIESDYQIASVLKAGRFLVAGGWNGGIIERWESCGSTNSKVSRKIHSDAVL